MKRPTPAITDQPGGLEAFPDDIWAKKLPLICEFLSHDRYEDGTARDLSTVSIKLYQGRITAVLNDPDLERSLYVSGDSVMKAMESLEKAAGSSNADWRAWKGKTQKKK